MWRSGLDKPRSLYYYVGSKNDLFRAVVSRAPWGRRGSGGDDDVRGSSGDEEAGAVDPAAHGLVRARVSQSLYVFVEEDPEKLCRRKSVGRRTTLEQAERYFAIVEGPRRQGHRERRLCSPASRRRRLEHRRDAQLVAPAVRPEGLLSAEELGSWLARLARALAAGRESGVEAGQPGLIRERASSSAAEPCRSLRRGRCRRP